MLDALEAESEFAELDEEILAEELEIDLGDDPLGDEVDLLAEEEQPEEDFVTPSAELESYPELELDDSDELAISLDETDSVHEMSETERQLAESLGSQNDLHLQLEDELAAPFEDDLDDLFDEVDLGDEASGDTPSSSRESFEHEMSLESNDPRQVVESIDDEISLDLDAPFDEAAALAAMDDVPEPAIQSADTINTPEDLSIDLDTPFDEAAAMAAMDEGLATSSEPALSNEMIDEQRELAQDLAASFDEEAAKTAADEAIDSLGQPTEDVVPNAEELADLDIDPERFLDQLEEIAEDDIEAEIPVEIDESAIEDEFMADLEETDFESLLDEQAEPEALEPDQQPELEVNFDALLSEELDEPFEVEEESATAEMPDETQQVPEDFLNIDDLIAESDDILVQEEPYQEPNMDVGLDDFEDLLAGDNPPDVDLEEDGFAAKLDLARAYLEIEDFDSAVSALEEVMEKGPESVQEEARILKAQIK
ncbi:hypothetical protein L1286_03775 [Pseudoalteromonas sp. SMS1]|uniref:FimV/HubP family polar landmark protein n=1 Tax=Pseudoalteromonas sp. SMS1 TaxID=2908894 RepID=UPI001F3966B4|nr:FimV/HubP family polar landmark protein [Pseudoalteromonas sp. SMS1]MCF2856575.1 hypothetical protein [Pseudoalteromonas sp. SMS1]